MPETTVPVEHREYLGPAVGRSLYLWPAAGRGSPHCALRTVALSVLLCQSVPGRSSPVRATGVRSGVRSGAVHRRTGYRQTVRAVRLGVRPPGGRRAAHVHPAWATSKMQRMQRSSEALKAPFDL